MGDIVNVKLINKISYDTRGDVETSEEKQNNRDRERFHLLKVKKLGVWGSNLRLCIY